MNLDRNINGCALCDHPERDHGQRYLGAGFWHHYVSPPDDQRLRRLREFHPKDTRPSFDEYYLMIAQTAAVRGDCRRSQVGAVMVCSDRRTVLLGYNGTVAGQPGCLLGACPRGLKNFAEVPPYSDYSDCIGIHAEDNLLATAFGVGVDVEGSTVYVTREPCDGCYTLLADCLVSRVVFPGSERHHEDGIWTCPPRRRVS